MVRSGQNRVKTAERDKTRFKTTQQGAFRTTQESKSHNRVRSGQNTVQNRSIWCLKGKTRVKIAEQGVYRTKLGSKIAEQGVFRIKNGPNWSRG